MISYNTNPLLSPHWAALNVFVGFAVFFWIITPVSLDVVAFILLFRPYGAIN